MCLQFAKNYINKIVHVPTLFTRKPRLALIENSQASVWSFIGTFIGIGGLALIHYLILEPHYDEWHLTLLTFNFGAAAVIVKRESGLMKMKGGVYEDQTIWSPPIHS